MALSDILERCAEINAGIAGLAANYGYDGIPDSLNTANVPCAMVLPLSGDYRPWTAGMLRASHRIRIWIIGQPLGQASAAARLGELAPFEPALRNAYLAAIKLNALGNVSQATLDTYRYFVVDYAGINYAALEFILVVDEMSAANMEA